MNKTYTKPEISVTKLEAEDVIATSGIMEQAAPANTITTAGGTTINDMTNYGTKEFNTIYN